MFHASVYSKDFVLFRKFYQDEPTDCSYMGWYVKIVISILSSQLVCYKDLTIVCNHVYFVFTFYFDF